MNTFRRYYLMLAELMDALRIIPRAMVAGYACLIYATFDWYMDLEPYFPKDITPMLGTLVTSSADIQLLLIEAPTTQHTAVFSAVIGFSSAVFAFYAAGGFKWNDYVFKPWRFREDKESDDTDSKDNTTD